jgi:CheY-like chemotaxis protein
VIFQFLKEIIPLNDIVSLLRGISFICALFLITVVFDSLRREAIERAEEATKVRTLFLANMSHELRTPMNGVIGITELILAGNISEDNRAQLELVKRSGIQMVSLINDILDLTRLESSRLKLENVPTDVRTIVSDVVELLIPKAEQKKLKMISEIDSQIPIAILSDPTRLKQVLTNLLNNAVKFTNKGEVNLKAIIIGNRIKFSISDTGIGIRSDILQKLFVPFEQADVSFTRRYGGSGLGLAISRKLVYLMGGIIDVESKEGIGSTFSFDLPCVPCSPIPSPKFIQSEPSDLKTPLKILVVEDNEVNLYVVLNMLKRFSCYTETARDGLEAIEAVKKSNFDLILMDCHMPNMDGFEATRQIRKMSDPINSIPILALTASALSEDIEQCRAAGMDSVLTKPLNMLELKNL